MPHRLRELAELCELCDTPSSDHYHCHNEADEIDIYWDENEMIYCDYHLIELFLEWQEITKFPNLFSLDLVILDLSYNEIEYIPQDIAKLENLEVLEISWNNLISIDNLFKLVNLKHLDVSYNHIKVIPPGIENLEDLLYLDISFNQINTLSYQITKLKLLYHLDVSWNDIKDVKILHEYFNNIRCLKTIQGKPSLQSYLSPYLCPICLLVKRSDIHTSLSCGHIFHNTCIINWLKENTSCPICHAIPQIPKLEA